MNRDSSRFDVVIVGGGIIGCALARELAGRGRRVAVVEKEEPGAEASSAAAGMLSPQAESTAPGPLFPFGLESRALHRRWAQDLTTETGIDMGYRWCGILRCSFSPAGRLAETFGWQKAAGLDVEALDGAAAAARAGGRLSEEISEALFFPQEGIVDGGLLTRALALSAASRGASLLTRSTARRFLIDDERCVGVETDRGCLRAGQVVDAAGTWAAFDPGLSFSIPVEPVRGQIVELEWDGELPCVVQDEEVYLVPRPGGRLLVGATVERVGFRKEVTAGGVSGLIAAAVRLLPDLSGAVFVRAWSGLRPGTPDDLPILGRSPIPGLFLATGHFRNGILLAPATAIRMVDLFSGAQAPDMAAFSIDRFLASRSSATSSLSPRSGVFG